MVGYSLWTALLVLLSPMSFTFLCLFLSPIPYHGYEEVALVRLNEPEIVFYITHLLWLLGLTFIVGKPIKDDSIPLPW